MLRVGEYTVAVSVAHAAHLPGRPDAMARMIRHLLVDGYTLADIHIESGKAPPHVWSERQWVAALEERTTHCLMLNDDLVLPPDFLEQLSDRIDQRPNDMISLYCSDPSASELHAAGHRWYSSDDGLIGNGYCMPAWMMDEFLSWRKDVLVERAIETLSEDQLICLFAMCTGRRIYHTIPTLVEHDVTIASAFGNEGNAARTSTVGLNATRRYPAPDEPTPHLGRFFQGNHFALLTHIRPMFWANYNLVHRYYQLSSTK